MVTTETVHKCTLCGATVKGFSWGTEPPRTMPCWNCETLDSAVLQKATES